MSKSRATRAAAALMLIAGAAFAPGAGAGPLSSAGAQERRAARHVYDGGRFEVDVLVGGSPLEEFHARGRTYIEALHGEEYVLLLRNPLPVRVAVALSVDGLNTIDARRTSSWDATKWVIEPYGTIRVSGWQMSTERARRFYFTTETDSYAARLGRAADLGTITAVFYREAGAAAQITPPPPRRPRPHTGERSDERGESEGQSGEWRRADKDGPVSSAGIARAPDDDYPATGIGRSVTHNVRRIDMSLERHPAAQVSLRYEFRPALVRLGVLPRTRPPHDALRRRERARGFEDFEFSPEP